MEILFPFAGLVVFSNVHPTNLKSVTSVSEQLNEANRKNEILENALRILAKQQHNLEVTLNESFRSVDSRVINRIEKAVTRRNNSALATTTVSSGMTTTTVDIERSPSRSASFEELPGVNGEAKIQDEEDDDLFFDAISINSNGSVVSAASEFHFDDQARLVALYIFSFE